MKNNFQFYMKNYFILYFIYIQYDNFLNYKSCPKKLLSVVNTLECQEY